MNRKPKLYKLLYSEISPIITFAIDSRDHALRHHVAIFKDSTYDDRHLIISTSEELDKIVTDSGGEIIEENDQDFIRFKDTIKVLVFGEEILANRL